MDHSILELCGGVNEHASQSLSRRDSLAYWTDGIQGVPHSCRKRLHIEPNTRETRSQPAAMAAFARLKFNHTSLRHYRRHWLAFHLWCMFSQHQSKAASSLLL